MNIEDARKEATRMYKDLQPIIKSVVDKHSKELDSIIKQINKNIDTLTNKELQTYMLQLSVESYYFSQAKDWSLLKADCALAILKSNQAEIFNGTIGTQAVRSNQSIIDSLDKQVVSMLQSNIAAQLKSKLDEAHRLVGVLTNILISKNAENKLKGVQSSSEDNISSNNVSDN